MFFMKLFPHRKRRQEIFGLTGEIVNEHVVGITYEGGEDYVSKLCLQQQVWLLREPDNEFDKNAIVVAIKRGGGRKLGYIRRELAANLALQIDLSQQKAIPARITELSSDTSGKNFNIGICLQVPKECVRVSKGGVSATDRRQIEFHCDDSKPSLYVVLNCSEKQFVEIKDKLIHEKLFYKRSGLCYWPVDNGHPYQWYLRFNGDADVSKERIEEFFRVTFDVVPDRERLKAIKDAQLYLNMAESLLTENGELREKLSSAGNALRKSQEESEYWKARAHTLQEQLEEHQHEIDKYRGQLKHRIAESMMLKHLLPDIEFLHDSVETLFARLPDQGDALRVLYDINYKRGDVIAKKVESTDGWKELHSGKQGRIYFKKFPDAKCRVLVSLKKDQTRDVEFLKGYNGIHVNPLRLGAITEKSNISCSKITKASCEF